MNENDIVSRRADRTIKAFGDEELYQRGIFFEM